MSDRQRVVYKTPLYRFLEVLLVLVAAFALAWLSHYFRPDLSSGWPIAFGLVLGLALVRSMGDELALRFGGSWMTAEERSRRYIRDVVPLVPVASQPKFAVAHARSARSRRRSR